MSDDPQNNKPADDTQTPETQPGQQSADSSTGVPQEIVNKLVGEARQSGRTSAEKSLLEALGLDSIDALKSLVESEKQRKEAEMSEVEKAQALAEKARQELEAARNENAKILKQMRDNQRDSGLLSLLSNAHEPQKALILLKAEKAEAVDSLLGEDGTFNTEAAQKLITDYQTQNGYLFKSSNPGSPSNSGGKPPKPQAKLMEEAALEVKNKFGSI